MDPISLRPSPLNILWFCLIPDNKLRRHQPKLEARKGLQSRRRQKKVKKLKLDSPAMGTRSKTINPSSPAMSTRK